MGTPEGAVEDKVVRESLHSYGVRSKKLVAVDDTGWPDRIFFIPGGRPLLIEFKRPGAAVKPGSKQQYIIDQLRSWGYDVQIHDNAEQAIQAIATAVATALISKKGDKIPA